MRVNLANYPIGRLEESSLDPLTQQVFPFLDAPGREIWKKIKFFGKIFSPQFSVSEIRFDAEFKQFEPIFCFVIHMASTPFFKLFS